MRVLIMQLNSISVMDLVAYGGAALGIILSVLEYRAGAVTFAECFFIIMISAEFFLPLRLLGSFFHIAMNGNAAADKIFRFLIRRCHSMVLCRKRRAMRSVFPMWTLLTHWMPRCCAMWISPCRAGVLSRWSVNRVVEKYGRIACDGENRPKEGGSVTIGGVPVTELTAEALYRKVTRVRHDSYLFAGTVEDNLRMGKADATQKRWRMRF